MAGARSRVPVVIASASQAASSAPASSIVIHQTARSRRQGTPPSASTSIQSTKRPSGRASPGPLVAADARSIVSAVSAGASRSGASTIWQPGATRTSSTSSGPAAIRTWSVPRRGWPQTPMRTAVA
jgi:hypothetical protein